MSNKTITHEIAIPRSLTVILAALAIGVLANAFAPVLHVQSADANLGERGSVYNPLHIAVRWPTASQPISVQVTEQQAWPPE